MAEEPQDATAEAPRKRMWFRPRRLPLYALAFLAAVFAALVVTFFTVDVGPALKSEAETRASKYLERPMHIGRVVAKLTPGAFEFHDVVIEGLTPQAPPFLKAKKITVALPWWTAFERRLIVESIDMTDWEMVIETFPGGKHNVPKLAPRTTPGQPKRDFTTTLRRVIASRGHIKYFDHSTPWSVDAPNAHITYFRREALADYGGTAAFEAGTIRIQAYEPFKAAMKSRFTMNGPHLHFDRIDLLTDGATSVLEGDLHFNKWPEQKYQVTSKIDIATQKAIYFKRDRFTATGQADFDGSFHYFKGGRELKGNWRTPLALVKIGEHTWRFPDLKGKVLWVPDRLEVTDTTSGFYGGTTRFDYRLLSLDRKSGPKRAVWDVEYRDVQLPQLTDFLQTEGLRLDGLATGRNRLEWPLGKWDLLRGSGELAVQPPPGVAVMTRELRPEVVARQAALTTDAGPFNRFAPLGYVPIGANLTYTLDPTWIHLAPGWVATPKTFVEFEGRTAYMKDSRIQFHVTSLDWQESDRVFAGVLTMFGSRTGAIPIGGYGEFDGVMLKTFAKPRIEGTFSGDRMRAWDVDWGKATAKLAIENSYTFITESTLTKGDSTITAAGTFSLGYPRRDRGEEINARVKLTRRPLADLRHAFELDDWPVEGLVSGEYHIYGSYETPHGFGTLVIDNGTAYGEPFERATASLGFEGNGVRLTKFEVQKGTGSMTGAAWVGWDGTYSFNADGRRIPVESLQLLEFPKAPLSGLVQFSASGAGTFEDPRYDVKVRVDDLFAGDEGIGALTGQLGLRGELLNVNFDAASTRLAVSGAGRIALTEARDVELTLRFSETSLDPYVRFFEPRLSPFTNAIVGGTVRVSGELADLNHLVVDANVEQLDLKLFDYQLRNKGPIAVALERNVIRVRQMALEGEGTALVVSGDVSLQDRTIGVTAEGDANLGILQGFFRDLRSSGSASLRASISGSLNKPAFSGTAGMKDGRIRYLPLPHGLEAINGTLSFDGAGIRVDDVRARVGRGDVVFGGRIAMNGFVPGDLNLTATGERMNIRYIEGFPAVVDADLVLRGSLAEPVLSGTVTVRDALWTRRFEATPDIISLATGEKGPLGAAAGPPAVPMRLDIHVVAPGTLRIENNLARLRASADLRLGGTYDRPQLLGRAEIVRGDLIFEGNRYVVTRGSVDFSNPLRIDPYVDMEAETRVRVPASFGGGGSQTFRVTIGVTGTATQFTPTINSDPPLPEIDIVSLLLGQTTNVDDADLRLRNPATASQSERELLRAFASRLIASPISAPVGRVVEETLGFDTVQITPSIGTESDPLNPSARLIIGKRISNRAYLTFARALGGSSAVRDQIITVEYDQNDRLGFVITQTGNNTFAIDFRVRHIF
jgi:hypothetical protein